MCWNELTTYSGGAGYKPLAGVVNRHPLYQGIFKQLRIKTIYSTWYGSSWVERKQDIRKFVTL